MKGIKYASFLIYLLFLFACAKQSAPTGGPKDTIPPRVLSFHPENNTTNFSGNTFEVTFNEYVQLKNAKEQILINPSVGKNFEATARKNKVILTVESKLQDTTTYTVNFRDAVTDITEQNPAENLRFAVSTGPYVDSMTIAGSVTSILDAKEQQDITVGMQPYSDTFSIFKHTFTYFTKTDKKGNFKIENLKPGLYWLAAIKDVNRNLIADTKSESYGFLGDSILLDGNKQNIHIGLARQDARPLRITSARPYNTYFNIKASKNLDTYKVTAQDSTDLYHTFGPDRSTILIYNNIDKRDSLLVNLSLTDSINNTVDSSFYIKFKTGSTPEKFTMSMLNTKLIGHNHLLSFDIKLSKPLRDLNFDSLFFQVDSLTKITFTPSDIKYDEPERILTVSKKLPSQLYKRPSEPDQTQTQPAEEKWNILYLGKGALITIENDSSNRLNETIPLQWESDLAVISAETRSNQPTIIQLLDPSLKPVRTVHGNRATFTDLTPSDYQIRVILDRNNNGKWDGGNYLTHEEPEEIIFYQTEKKERTIRLKANFEIGPLLITY